MFYDSQDLQMMQFMESPICKQTDFFKEILDCPPNSEQRIGFYGLEKRASFSRFEDEIYYSDEINKLGDKIQQENKNKANEGSTILQGDQMLNQKNAQKGQEKERVYRAKRLFFAEKKEQAGRSTRCQTSLDQQHIVIEQLEKPEEMVVDFTENQVADIEEQSSLPNKKTKKLKKKFDKYIMKEKSFGKTLKLSFPKKLVQMFLNHYSKFPIQSEEIKKYNDGLKLKLKESKKNDYTFEKQVSQILGENDSGIQETLSAEIGFSNREIFSQIINTTMKEEVIMRDKIAKNRELYMIQLKVYALRCRSQKLSKKGTYK